MWPARAADTDPGREGILKKPVAIGLLLTVGYPHVIALAQTSPDPMEACFRISDAGERVACFDREMQRRHAAAAAQSATPATPAAPPAAPAAPAATPNIPAAPAATVAAAPAATARPAAADDTVGLDGRQLLIRRKEEGITPQAAPTIVAVLARVQERPGRQYRFELDNGQVWESTDAAPELFLGPHEPVVIRPGVLGAFFLKTGEGNSIRVHRVR
jgi:pyruvate/2-oxoglutarate dehydrogenase complex dihydrolipoamide acyltransferase (E2) component